MRVRWGRVGSAVAALLAGPPAAFFAAMAVTRPPVSTLERVFPGGEDCVASEVVGAALAHHEGGGHHEPGTDASDRAAAEALLRASRCRSIGELHWTRVMDAFWLGEHGVAWIAANEDGETARDHALAVAELAADQRRSGAWVNVVVWARIGLEAAELVERNLRVGPPDDRAEAGRRLAAVAAAPLAWGEVHAREERMIWEGMGKDARSVLHWEGFLLAPRMLMTARRGTHPLVADAEEQVAVLRVDTAAIAAAAVLSGRAPGAPCPSGVDVGSDLGPIGVRLVVDPDLCVVAAASADRLRMASAR